VEFVVGEFNVAGDMAFVALKAQRPGGGSIDSYRTPFAEENGEEAVSMFDCCHVEAVLQKNQGSGESWNPEWGQRMFGTRNGAAERRPVSSGSVHR